LSILDLAGGRQPMPNEDGSLWITFNGEVFNYVEIAEELQGRGHVMRTRSDTEVIVHAFEQWGDEAFARFNGQFAVALWDAARGVLTLARDRVGVRPLYVGEHDGRLWFASEVKAIFAADRAIPRRLDPAGLDQVFTFWAPLAPRTVFDSVEEIEPGHVRHYGPQGVRDRAFWSPRYPAGRDAADGAFGGSLAEATEAVAAALQRATSLRMLRADVPVGSYLSGGIDSSLIAALGLRAKGERFKTFSLRFADAEYDETPYQRMMARRLGSEHAEIVVSRADIAAAFPGVVRHAERPILRTAPAPMYMLSKLVHDEGIKVVLTGEGADEFFAGYDLFREARVRRFWARRPDSPIRPRLLDRLYPYLARSPVAQQAIARQFFGRQLEKYREPGFGHGLRWQSAAALKRLFSREMAAAVAGRDAVAELCAALPPEFERWSFLARDQYLEVRTLLSAYLLSSQGDRMLMAHSVEGRFPFLDADVMELANALPPEYKLAGLDEKHVLKRAAAEVVPREILERKKQPYRAPDALSFVGADAPGWVEDALDPAQIAAAGVFDPAPVGRLWQKLRGRPDATQFSQADNMALVGILSTQLTWSQLVRDWEEPAAPSFRTVVDRVPVR
jgi:asparagine synthase (glutamine-hydrolysing)